jgi:hypothetical protein
VATRRVRKQQRTPKAQAQATGGRITTLDPAMLQPMVEAVVRQVTPQIISTLRDGNFLGPMQPVPPVPVGDETSVAWEYPAGYNVSVQPRKYTPISAQELQWIADNLDVLRQIIERRKAELCSLDFEIVFLDEDKDSSNDPTITKIREFLRFPGGRDWPWATWLGSLLEDIFVIDAPTIEPRYTYGGDIHALDIISGAMIMPLIDDSGRIPDPPDPGYVQVRYGLPKVFFTKDELLYMPKNRRPYSPIYGFSRVQGVIMSVSIAVRLEQRDNFYFTAGTIPDYLMTTPESWNGKQIAAFQTYWDNLMSGNMRARFGGVRFVPGGLKEIAIKNYAFSLEQWEWLARVICAAFSVTPQPYVRQMNRATAFTQRQTSMELFAGSSKAHACPATDVGAGVSGGVKQGLLQGGMIEG